MLPAGGYGARSDRSEGTVIGDKSSRQRISIDRAVGLRSSRRVTQAGQVGEDDDMDGFDGFDGFQTCTCVPNDIDAAS
jgi:hypothetical protein